MPTDTTPPPPEAQTEYASVVFTGGMVFAGAGDPVEGLAVAVAGERILAVGDESRIAEFIGPATRVVALGGALLSPGFQDAHAHPIGAGVEMLTCYLYDAGDAAETLAIIAAYAESHPELPWILGTGWTMSHFSSASPTRAMLDAVVPDRPVLLHSRDFHSVWANTAAIMAAGLGPSTPDPAGGRVDREPDGHPAGAMHEGAQELFSAVRPTPSADEAYAGLLLAQDALIGLGITGWQDASVRSDDDDVYRRAVDEGTLLAHVVGAQWWKFDGGLEQIEQMVERRNKLATLGRPDRYSLGTVKIMLDGIAENQTAAMLAPYRDSHGHSTDNAGLSFIDPTLLTQAVAALDAEGMQLHFHALGDRAVRDALDAIEAARRANGPNDTRHHLAHLQFVAEEEQRRLAQLGVVANLQMLWAAHEAALDQLTLPFLPPGAEAHQYPFGTLERGGVRLAAGSDWPVTSADPIAAVHVAVNRSAPGAADEPLGGEQQCISLVSAMTAYTSGTAHVNHREHDTGFIRAGYLANLVVIDPNPFVLPREEIHRATVVSTWIEGESVYTRTP